MNTLKGFVFSFDNLIHLVICFLSYICLLFFHLFIITKIQLKIAIVIINTVIIIKKRTGGKDSMFLGILFSTFQKMY